MSQYKTGTCNVGQQSDLAVVDGNGTAWNGLSLPLYFKIDEDGTPVYEVASIDSDTQLTLTANYAGTPATGLDYQLVQDFSSNLSIPLPSQGDADAGDWIRRSIVEMDQWLFGPKWGQNTETLSANKTLTASSARFQFLDANGARDVILPAEASSEHLFFIIFETGGGSADGLTVKDDDGGTIITIGSGAAGLVACNGTVWKGLLGS